MQIRKTIARCSISLLLVLIAVSAGSGQTYTTIANGNWSSSATWFGGSVPPTGSEIPASAVINIHHTVAYNTGDTIKNNGEIRIQPIVGTTAMLTVPTGINIENLATGDFYVINGSLIQCRFVGCNDGQPYSGTNPGAPLQSGSFKNVGGFVQVANSTVEIAQDWTNESGGDRTLSDSCVKTGQNFSLSGSGSTDSITRSQISVGWHGSGSYSHSDGVTVYTQVRFQLAGTSGNFSLSSGTVNGDIDTIQLRNQIVPFNGGGGIFASSSITTIGITLDERCSSSYTPNGKFVGAQVSNCSNGSVTCFGPSAATASIQGRVYTPDGRGISQAVIEIYGSETGPVRTVTNSFGYYIVENLEVGHTYLLTVRSKRYTFVEPARVVMLDDSLTDIDFISELSGAVWMPSKR